MSESDETKDGGGNGTPTNGTQPASEAGAKQAEAPAEAPVLTIEQRLLATERARAEAQDRMLRVAADFENYKRRQRRETDDAIFRSREQLLKEILPAIDNLDRALVAANKGGSVEALAQGVRLVDKQLHSALEKLGVTMFEAKGEAFDPARHEAVQQVEDSGLENGRVVDVFARGYMLGERLLRPAMVSVAKGKPSAPVSPDTDVSETDGGDEEDSSSDS